MADWDVTINNVNYMLEPKTYESKIVGGPPGHTTGQPPASALRTSRTRITDFAAGQGHPRTLRAAANERAGLLSGLGAFPAPWPMTMHAVANHPARQAVTTGLSISSALSKWVQPMGDTYLYVAFSTRIDRWDKTTSAPTSRTTSLGPTCTGLCTWNNKLYLAFDGSADVKTWADGGSGSLTASALGAGKKSYGATGRNCLVTHGGGVWTVDVSDRTAIRAFYDGASSVHQAWNIQGSWLNWCSGQDALYIATTGGMMRVTGNWLTTTTNDFKPTSWAGLANTVADTDDYTWMQIYTGRLFTWAGGAVVYYDTARDTWRHAGLEGSTTYGAAVVNNVLYVALSPIADTATYELWAYTGSGWWRIESDSTSNWGTIGATGAGQLLTMQGGNSRNMWFIDVADRLTAANQITPWHVVTPAIDAGDPTHTKTWTTVGVETLRNDGQVVGTWSLLIETSTDAGQNWTSAGSAESITDEVETTEYTVSLTSTTLMIRATLTSTSGLTPHIVAIWADATWTEEPPTGLDAAITAERRRQWTFDLPCSDTVINRAGAADARTGQQIRTTLWALWGAGSVQFRDVDYGATTTEHTVRVTDISEDWQHPADQADIGAHSTITLTLQEV